MEKLVSVISRGAGAGWNIALVAGFVTSYKLTVPEELTTRSWTTILIFVISLIMLLLFERFRTLAKRLHEILDTATFMIQFGIFIVCVIAIIFLRPGSPPLSTNASSSSIPSLLVNPCDREFGNGSVPAKLTCYCGHAACKLTEPVPKYVPGCVGELQFVNLSSFHCLLQDDGVLRKSAKPHKPKITPCFTEADTNCFKDDYQNSVGIVPDNTCDTLEKNLKDLRLERNCGSQGQLDVCGYFLKHKSSTGSHVPMHLNTIEEFCEGVTMDVKLRFVLESETKLFLSSEDEKLIGNSSFPSPNPLRRSALILMAVIISVASQMHFILSTCIIWRDVSKIPGTTSEPSRLSLCYAGIGATVSWLGFAYPFPCTSATEDMICWTLVYMFSHGILCSPKIVTNWKRNGVQPSLLDTSSGADMFGKTIWSFETIILFCIQFYFTTWTGYVSTMYGRALKTPILDWIQYASLIPVVVVKMLSMFDTGKYLQETPDGLFASYCLKILVLVVPVQIIVIISVDVYNGEPLTTFLGALMKSFNVALVAGFYILTAFYLDKNTGPVSRPLVQSIFTSCTLIGLGAGHSLAFLNLQFQKTEGGVSHYWLIPPLIPGILIISLLFSSNRGKHGGFQEDQLSKLNPLPPNKDVTLFTDGSESLTLRKRTNIRKSTTQQRRLVSPSF